MDAVARRLVYRGKCIDKIECMLYKPPCQNTVEEAKAVVLKTIARLYKLINHWATCLSSSLSKEFINSAEDLSSAILTKLIFKYSELNYNTLKF